jgi:hypothetical protein
VLGVTVVSFTGMEVRPSPQYIQQWSASLDQSLDKSTVLEIGYPGSRGMHLQRAHLINNAQPEPGLIQPRRPHHKISFVPDTVLPPNVPVSSSTRSTTPIWEPPNRFMDTAGFGSITEVTAPGRQIQLSARLSF